MKKEITVEASINAPIEKAWECWTKPEHIVKWCFASDDWHAPSSTNDLRIGGRFSTRMEAKNGKESFDFDGVYTKVDENEKIEYTMDGEDERKVRILFEKNGEKCRIIETFDAENENSLELQRDGWQSILNNFKKYAESV